MTLLFVIYWFVRMNFVLHNKPWVKFRFRGRRYANMPKQLLYLIYAYLMYPWLPYLKRFSMVSYFNLLKSYFFSSIVNCSRQFPLTLDAMTFFLFFVETTGIYLASCLGEKHLRWCHSVVSWLPPQAFGQSSKTGQWMHIAHIWPPFRKCGSH